MCWEVARHLHLRQAMQGEEGASPYPRDAVALGDLAAAQTPGVSHQPADESQAPRQITLAGTWHCLVFFFFGGNRGNVGSDADSLHTICCKKKRKRKNGRKR